MQHHYQQSVRAVCADQLSACGDFGGRVGVPHKLQSCPVLQAILVGVAAAHHDHDSGAYYGFAVQQGVVLWRSGV